MIFTNILELTGHIHHSNPIPQTDAKFSIFDLSRTFHKQVTSVSQHVFVVLLWRILMSPLGLCTRYICLCCRSSLRSFLLTVHTVSCLGYLLNWSFPSLLFVTRHKKPHQEVSAQLEELKDGHSRKAEVKTEDTAKVTNQGTKLKKNTNIKLVSHIHSFMYKNFVYLSKILIHKVEWSCQRPYIIETMYSNTLPM